MAARSMADAVRAVLVKRAFVPGDPSMAGGMPPGVDPSMAGGMPPSGDPMAGMPMPPPDQGMAPQSGMINMTADEFTKFVKQMMAAFSQNGMAAAAQPQQSQQQPDIGAKLDTLIAVLQAQGGQAAPAGV